MAEQRDSLRNQSELQSTKQQLKATEDELKRAQNQLQEKTQNLEDVKETMEARLQAKDQEIAEIKKDVQQLKETLASREKEVAESKEKYQEIITGLDNRSQRLEDKIQKLVTAQYYFLHKTQSSWSILLNTLASVSEPVLPVIVRMDGFMAKKESEVVNNWWYSNGFYSCNGGYKMCLGVVACGYYANPEQVSRLDYDRGFVTASLFLMRGEYDDQLVWPKPVSTVTFQLLNQICDADHLDPVVCRFDGHTSGSKRVTYAPISN